MSLYQQQLNFKATMTKIRPVIEEHQARSRKSIMLTDSKYQIEQLGDFLKTYDSAELSD